MGTDKSFVNIHGKSLIAHVMDQVRVLSLPIILIANHQERYKFLGVPVFGDLVSGKGSLGGLYTALFHSSTSHLLCVACDMPCLNPSLLCYLIDQVKHYDAVIPRVDNLPQAFHAIYRKSCLPPIERQINQGNFKVRDLFPMIDIRYIDNDELQPFDPLFRSFTNINTPEALIEYLGC